MAKGNIVLGTARGSFGDITLKVVNGKQVISRKGKAKNPRTQRQMIQRMIFYTMIQAQSAMKNIVDHSFEGVNTGTDSLSYFARQNVAMLRAGIVTGANGKVESSAVDFNMKNVNYPVLNPWVVAKGTLSEVTLIESLGDIHADFNDQKELGLSFSTRNELRLALGDFSSNRDIKNGDYVTFLLMFRVNGKEREGQQLYRFGWVRCNAARVSTLQSQVVLTPTLTNFGEVTEVTWEQAFKYTAPESGKDSLLRLDLSTVFSGLDGEEPELTPVAYAVIKSRQQNDGSWLRSNAEFVVRDNLTDLNIEYPGDFFEELDTYTAKSSIGETDRILDGGDS